MIKASGRSALILAAGLFVCFAGPSQAAATADGTAASSKSATSKPDSAAEAAKHASLHHKKIAHRRSGKMALKPATSRKAADGAADDGEDKAALPASVANANAQLASGELPAGNAKAMGLANALPEATPDSSANAQPAAETQVVAADQLNDVDRALHDSKKLASNQAMASADVPAVPTTASSYETSTWDQTSLIGKIFIGFGALLTMASAARMFMA